MFIRSVSPTKFIIGYKGFDIQYKYRPLMTWMGIVAEQAVYNRGNIQIYI